MSTCQVRDCFPLTNMDFVEGFVSIRTLCTKLFPIDDQIPGDVTLLRRTATTANVAS